MFVRVPKVHNNEESQPLRLTVGAPVICCKYNKKLDVIKNDKYNVESWTDTEIRLRHSSGTLKDIAITTFQSNFLVGYCITTHKAQGATIDKPFTIWEIDEMLKHKLCRHMDKCKMLYTALTRTTKRELVSLAKDPLSRFTFEKPELFRFKRKVANHAKFDQNKMLVGKTITVFEWRVINRLTQVLNIQPERGNEYFLEENLPDILKAV